MAVEILTQLETDFAVIRISLDCVDEQDVNARHMPAEMLRRLAENIAKDGRLESLPLGVLHDDGRLSLISGHHRTRAAKIAGLKEIVALAYLRELTRQELVAKQIAHNALQGEDDKDTLRRLLSEVQEPLYLLETGLDTNKLLAELAKSEVAVPVVDLSYRYWGLAFLSHEFAAFEELCGRIDDQQTTVALVGLEHLEGFRATCRRLGKTDDIRATDAVIARMVEIANEYLDEKEAEAAAH